VPRKVCFVLVLVAIAIKSVKVLNFDNFDNSVILLVNLSPPSRH
jgi:hypothetical protein